MTDSQTATTVLAYVRLGGDEGRDSREISFRVPEGISQADLLAEGFAIDGNSAAESVTSYTRDTDGEFVPLMDVLHDRQRYLVEWFAKHGLTLQFA